MGCTLFQLEKRDWPLAGATVRCSIASSLGLESLENGFDVIGGCHGTLAVRTRSDGGPDE